MDSVILHQYEVSPFAHKARSLLGYKRLAWSAVEIPVVMPKPDLLALSGGYRKTPVMQIGADVYCDTALIARVLDERFPERPVFRAGCAAIDLAAGRWFDRELFLGVISQLFDPKMALASAQMLGGMAGAAAFAEDRGRLMKGMPVRPPRPEDGAVVVAQVLAQLEAQLSAGGPHLAGAEPGWADFCAYAPLWTMERHAGLKPRLDAFPAVLAWLTRMNALGQGRRTELGAGDAIALARDSVPVALTGSQPFSIPLDSEVEVAAADYGTEPTAGRLVHVGTDELVLARTDERAGHVHVHFPRVGFRVKPRA